MGNVNTPESKEALVEYEVINTKMDLLECKVNSEIEEKEYCQVTNALDTNNPLGLDGIIKKVNGEPTQYFLAQGIHLLNKPLSAVDFKETLDLVNRLGSEKRAIYMDGNQYFRGIYIDDNFGHNNSMIFADSKVTGNTNTGNIKENPFVEVDNNQTEELFKFVKSIRNNPNDGVTKRLENTSLGNPENEDSTQIASILENKTYQYASTD